MRMSNFSENCSDCALVAAWRGSAASARRATSTMSAPCSTRTTAGSTIGKRGEADRAQARRAGPGADGDDAQGIRLQAQRQAAAHASCSASFRGSASPPPTAIRRRSTAPGRNTSARPAIRCAAAPISPTPWISSAGTMPRPPTPTASRADDTFNLYLAYYFGWSGYKRGDWNEKPACSATPATPSRWRANYAAQLQCRCDCGRRHRDDRAATSPL